MGENFIDRYIDLVGQVTDAPPLFTRASAYWLTSLLFGVYVICPIATPGTTRPNVWFLLSGPPGITRKSTVIDSLGRRFFRKLFSKYLMNKLQISEYEARRISDLVFIENATPEGLADHIQLTYSYLSGVEEEGNGESILDRYSLITTEFGGILRMCEREYMTGFKEKLSKIYYGEGDTFYLSKRGKKPEERIRHIPEGLYVCALVGIQKLNLYVSPELVKQGLLRRFIIIHQDIHDKIRRLPPLDPIRKTLYTEFEELAEDYTDMMENYNSFDPQTQRPLQVFVRMDKTVMDEINKFWQQCEDEYAKNTEDLWLLYKQSAWEHLIKLSVLEAIARTPEPDYRLGDLEIKVDKVDFERAFEFLQKVLKTAQPEVSSIGAQPLDLHLPLSQGSLNFIYNMVESAGSNGITRSDLLIKSGLLKEDLKRLIVTLIEQGRVVAYKYQPTGGGRFVIKFFAKKYEKHAAISGGQPIPSDTLEVVW